MENPNEMDDGFSKLPDDIMINILSRLTITDAVRTSVLSVQWRHLWRNFNGVLDFDFSHFSKDKDILKNWVDQVLKSVKNDTLKGLRIRFNPRVNFAKHIDDCVRFAIKKDVKELELELMASYDLSTFWYNGSPSPIFFPSLIDYKSFGCLQVLRLSFVHVNEQILEGFLSCCPLLETLSVSYAQDLSSLKVSTPSSNLKTLELMECYNLKALDISAKNLVSFMFSGYNTKVTYNYTPKLTQLYLFRLYVKDGFQDFFGLLPLDQSQLTTLKLQIVSTLPTCELLPKNFLLPNLHHLELITAMAEQELHFCISFINKCPSLRSLTLEIMRNNPYMIAQFGPKHPHYCLEEVKLIGFVGTRVEVELIKYIVENAIIFKKLIIVTNTGSTIEDQIANTGDFVVERTCIQDIKTYIPPWVELVIL